MTLSHDEIRTSLPDYLSKSLGPEMIEAIRTHLRECRICQEELSLLSELTSIEIPDPGERFFHELPARVAGTAGHQRFSLFRPLLRPLPLFSAALAASLIILFAQLWMGRTPKMVPYLFDPDLSEELISYGGVAEEDFPALAELPEEWGALSGDPLAYSYVE